MQFPSWASRAQRNCTFWPNLSKLDAECNSEQNSNLIYFYFLPFCVVPTNSHESGNAKLAIENKDSVYLSQTNVSERLNSNTSLSVLTARKRTVIYILINTLFFPGARIMFAAVYSSWEGM